jgi:hypothetical protein
MITKDIEVLAYYETIDGSGAMLSQMFTYDCHRCDYSHARGSRLLSEIAGQIAEHVLTQEHQEK